MDTRDVLFKKNRGQTKEKEKGSGKLTVEDDDDWERILIVWSIEEEEEEERRAQDRKKEVDGRDFEQ